MVANSSLDTYRKILLFFVLAWFSLACGKKNIPTKTVDTGKITTYDEDISVVRPKYEEKPSVVPVNTTPVTSGYSTTTPPPHENNAINQAIDAIADKNKSVTQTQGYRIQVFSGNSKTEYEQARGYILQYFPALETYVSYSQPTYRLKVGDFLTRGDAERYLSSLDSRFVGAKIIYDNIDYKKGLLIK